MTAKKRLLMIDSDEDSCEILSFFFEDNYQVVVAPTLAEGLRLARQECFDLYLLDLFFPENSGLELCQQIRAFDACTPLILWSSISRESIQQQALQSGAEAVLIKPVDLENLAETVANLIGVKYDRNLQLRTDDVR